MICQYICQFLESNNFGSLKQCSSDMFTKCDEGNILKMLIAIIWVSIILVPGYCINKFRIHHWHNFAILFTYSSSSNYCITMEVKALYYRFSLSPICIYWIFHWDQICTQQSLQIWKMWWNMLILYIVFCWCPFIFLNDIRVVVSFAYLVKISLHCE